MKLPTLFSRFSPLSFARLLLVAVTTLLFLAAPCSATNILILHSYHSDYPWTDSIDNGMKEVLNREFPDATLFVEYMDSKHHPQEELFPGLERLLTGKYAAKNLDIILCSDDNALDLLLTHHHQLFPGVPVVFCGINDFSDTRLAGRTGITGVTENHDLQGLLELALRLHLQTKTVAVISDVTRTGREMLAQLHSVEPLFRHRVEFLELAELSEPQLKKALGLLPPHSVVLNLSYFRDPDGRTFSVQQSNNLISEAGQSPIYVPWDFLIRDGVIGGRVVSGSRQGRNAARLAVRILNGESPEDIPPLSDIPSLFMFDHRVLQAFDIKSRQLPPDSVLLFHAWDYKHKRRTQIILGVAVLFFGLACTLGLFLLRYRKTLRALRLSEQKYKAVLQSIGEPIHIKDRDLNIIWANDIAQQTFGKNIIGQKCYKALHQVSTPCKESCTVLAAFTDGQPHFGEQEAFDASGNQRWFLNTTTVVSRDSRGDPATALTIARDITELKTIKQQYLLTQWAIDASLTPMIMTDLEGRLNYANRAALALWHYPTAADLLGSCLSDLHEDPHQSQKITQSLKSRNVWHNEGRGRKMNGACFDMDLQAQTIRNQVGAPLAIMLSAVDITDKKRTEAEIENLAYFDSLTGLPNRSLFKNHAELALGHAGRSNKIVALLMLDLDHFKHINDSMGHAMGDLLLQAVAERLQQQLRHSDILARWGGDEFILLLSDVNEVLDITIVTKKILRLLNEQPFVLEGFEIVTTASIGLALFPLDGQNMETLLKHADAAMYEAKKKGRNNYHFFSAQLAQQIDQRHRMEINLRRALKEEQLHLVYQPQIDLSLGKVTGMEALARWQRPGEESISPLRFIPLAEETGLIRPLGDWILRSACQQAVTWQQGNPAAPRVAVNFSAKQFFQPDLVQSIQEILRETGLPPQRLELELTESVFLENMEAAVEALKALKHLGIRIAIDDFGTGYSSLYYLKKLPFDRIKIAQEFVRDIESDANNRAIIKAAIAMAQSLGSEIIAEGVENRKQLSFLLSLGCQVMQGYYFAKPMPAKDLVQFCNTPLNSSHDQGAWP
jgi:diguanylate cyclase (GGDEF)-like protein/PAS domain S-box-containing protein